MCARDLLAGNVDLMAGISAQVQHFLFKLQTCQVSESQRDDGKSSIEEEEATDDIPEQGARDDRRRFDFCGTNGDGV